MERPKHLTRRQLLQLGAGAAAAGDGLRPMEQELMSTCFNPDTMRKAKAKGIDAEKARATVRQVLDAAFREAPDRPPNHPASVGEIEDRSPDFKFYNYSESPPKMLSWVKGALQGL